MGPCARVVVVGVDFSEMGDDAILEGLTQVVLGAARVAHFVYVLDSRQIADDLAWSGVTGEASGLVRAASALRQRVCDVAALAKISVPATRLRAHARIGHIVATLIHACVDYDADLLVLGTHARLELDRRILGPVADALVRRAPCPVLIARPKSHRSFDRMWTSRKVHVAPLPHTQRDVTAVVAKPARRAS